MRCVFSSCYHALNLRHGPRAAGFSLIELMVTLAVLSILIALATPSFSAVINSNRLTNQANGLVADLQLARSEALRRNKTVRLCRSDDGQTCATGEGGWTGWVVVLRGTPTELLRTNTASTAIEISGGGTIDFGPDGLARSSTGGLLATSFDICLPTRQPAENIRRVEMVGGSRLNIVTAASETPGVCS